MRQRPSTPALPARRLRGLARPDGDLSRPCLPFPCDGRTDVRATAPSIDRSATRKYSNQQQWEHGWEQDGTGSPVQSAPAGVRRSARDQADLGNLHAAVRTVMWCAHTSAHIHLYICCPSAKLSGVEDTIHINTRWISTYAWIPMES